MDLPPTRNVFRSVEIVAARLPLPLSDFDLYLARLLLELDCHLLMFLLVKQNAVSWWAHLGEKDLRDSSACSKGRAQCHGSMPE